MTIYMGDDLVNKLRKLCDSVERRLWIASPYVGPWDGVRKIVGRQWRDKRLPNNGIRLLTDPEYGSVSPATVEAFQAKGQVNCLRGLHAKLYIIDKNVILTSANLTRTAFSSRYEIGIHLRGTAAQHAIAVYEDWWKIARSLTADQLDAARTRGTEAGEDQTPGQSPLPRLWELPVDSGDIREGKDGSAPVFFVNTDRKHSDAAEKYMLSLECALAFGKDHYRKISRILRGARVMLYSNRIGIIAIGIATDDPGDRHPSKFNGEKAQIVKLREFQNLSSSPLPTREVFRFKKFRVVTVTKPKGDVGQRIWQAAIQRQ